MSITIPVSAEFDTDDIKKQIEQVNARFKSLGDTVGKATKTKFNPITLESKADLDLYLRKSQQLLKIQGELRAKMQNSGQGTKSPLMADFGQMYTNEATRSRKLQEMLIYYGGDFEDQPQAPGAPRVPPPANSGGGRRPPGGGGGGRPPASPPNPWSQQGTNILRSGLSAAGPVGGVASNALGAGMSGGIGAGLAGLVGGMVALAVGKLISAIADKIGDAQNEAMLNDTLMRRMGGAGSFLTQRDGIRGAAYATGMSFNDAQGQAANLVRTGNLSDSRQLPEELITDVGFARSFGLDPSKGVSTLGGLRGVGVTSDTQETRKMALLIGETIGKSRAFAKSEEVMDAIAGFATAQARQSLGSPNVAGYAGEFSALAGAGIPGLDPMGAANLIGRVNASLTNGGAHGEASQFFTSMVANRMGLDPIQSAIMREGGAFATNDGMFGSGSMYSRYMGKSGPKGSETFLQETLDTLRSRYKDPGMLAMATANHLGIGMNSAMALLTVKPNQVGHLQDRLGHLGVNLSDLNATGISDIARIDGASGDDLNKIGNEYLSRKGKGALNGVEQDRLRNTMNDGDPTKLKDLLTVLAAQKGQEETEGSKTRDTIAGVSNVMQEYASKSLPLLNDSRAALLFLAGKQGAGGPGSLRMSAITSEHDENVAAIKQQYQPLIDKQNEIAAHARLRTVGIPNEAESALPREQQLPAMVARQNAAKAEEDAATAEIARLEAERDKQIGSEGTRYSNAQEQEKKDSVERYHAQQAAQSNAVGGVDHDAIQTIESAGNPNAVSNKGAVGRMQTMPGTLADPGFGVAPAKDQSNSERERVGHQYLDAMMARYGNVDQAIAAYNAGPGTIDKLISKYGNDWLRHAPSETQAYVRKYHRIATVPTREAAKVAADDIGKRSSQSDQQNGPLTGEINVNLAMAGDLRRLIQQPDRLTTTVSVPKPFGK